MLPVKVIIFIFERINDEYCNITKRLFERLVCTMVGEGVAGIFGPQDKSIAEHVQSICDTLEMPHISVRWDPQEIRGKTVNLYPHANTLSLVRSFYNRFFFFFIFLVLYFLLIFFFSF